ncbi:MAG: 2-amino-4-hydroxy-6-hydroxymethyldihydropteridine diphosphokinase [Roseiflexaceae bacterium]|nr:2-amino-4-hydroxy-6-hydroxymethyldihydropteridine diphosphokinase [Roseiflexaceae bacterium]
MRQHNIYIGLGSNVGDRIKALRAAITRLSRELVIVKISELYVAAPLGYVRDDAFINCVLHAQTQIAPLELLSVLQRIEIELGRQPGVQYGPRPIDLDILFYDNLLVDSPLLKIPHPDLPKRAFVLLPLAEIAPNLVHPVLYYTAKQLLQDADDVRSVQRYLLPNAPAQARASV